MIGFFIKIFYLRQTFKGGLLEWLKRHAWSEGLLWRKRVNQQQFQGPKDSFGGSNPLSSSFLLIMYFTYILRSLKDHKFYYGSTNDLSKRLILHNGGKVRSTKGRRPLEIYYYEKFETRSEAYRRELFFKSINGYKYLREEGII